jgi:outer membrane protein TolC
MTGRAEILRADVLLSATLQDRLRAENGLTMARRDFNSLLNRDLDQEVSLEEAEVLAPMDLALEECIAKAFGQNPKLRSFQEQLKVAGKTVSLARSNFLPKLNLIFDYGWHEKEYRFHPDSDFWMLMGVASWELFSGSRNLARYKQSKAGYRQVEHELEAFRDGLRLQVTQAYLSLREARNRLDLAQRAMTSSEENYRVTEASYREGLATQVDEIDAQVTLTEARVTHAQTQYEMYKAQAKLENLMGMMPYFD